MATQFFIYDACMYEFEVHKTYLQKRPNWALNFDLEVLQMLCNNLDSFNDDYGRCLDAWSELKTPGAVGGTRSAVKPKCKSSSMILMFQVDDECLDSSYVIYVRCLKC